MTDYDRFYGRLHKDSLDLYFLTDREGFFIHLNEKTYISLNIDKDQNITDLNIKDYIYELSDWNNYLKKIEGKENISGFDISLKGDKGKIMTGVLSSSVQLNSEEQIVRAFLIHDISQHTEAAVNSVKLNLQLLDLNKKLKDAYNTMTHQEKLASIGQLSAGVAHEINNPLAFVSSNLISLKKYFNFLIQYDESSAIAEDKEEYEYIRNDISPLIEETEEGLNRIGNITKSLKRFSRTDDEYKSPDYDLNKAIEDTIAICKVQASDNTKIKTELGDIPLISCYGNDINQVLLNMLINAIQALSDMTADYEGVITIRTLISGKYVELVIEDNGSGIKEEVANKIFDPFFTTKEIGKGTGLGLGLCFSIISGKHKGRIWLDNYENPTRFIIKLPVNNHEI